MFRNKRTILISLTLVLLVAFGLLAPQFSSDQSLTNTPSALNFNRETELQSQDMQEGDMEEYKKPTYFNIFNFIFSFLPIKPNEKE